MSNPQNLSIGKPKWLKTQIPSGKVFFEVQRDLKQRNLVTVCEEAKCPNIGYCWSTRTATFMVLGDTCTRGCRFCNVKTGDPKGFLNPHEPREVSASCATMKLGYVVITMVDRDDLPDGGAEHVASVLSEVRLGNPQIKIELLAGDFKGQASAIKTILKSAPEVYAHNLETIERLTPRVRDRRASYRQSLEVLSQVKALAGYPVFTKSALMLGLGETLEEVTATLTHMREHDVDFITIGQYMRPSKKHLPIKEWVDPSRFQEIEVIAKELGFKAVASSPLVRSSYRAKEFYESATSSSRVT